MVFPSFVGFGQWTKLVQGTMVKAKCKSELSTHMYLHWGTYGYIGQWTKEARTERASIGNHHSHTQCSQGTMSTVSALSVSMLLGVRHTRKEAEKVLNQRRVSIPTLVLENSKSKIEPQCSHTTRQRAYAAMKHHHMLKVKIHEEECLKVKMERSLNNLWARDRIDYAMVREPRLVRPQPYQPHVPTMSNVMSELQAIKRMQLGTYDMVMNHGILLRRMATVLNLDSTTGIMVPTKRD
ncbi:hypothetical protein RJT34_05732 [Clitoria ternatea]|uniref:Uncharacterized protein n=1 Tax=Clitoria ternatea TaxID=43366 RepID=A0AAN9K3G6_CLITE